MVSQKVKKQFFATNDFNRLLVEKMQNLDFLRERHLFGVYAKLVNFYIPKH